MTSKENKFLKVKEGVVLTPVIEFVIVGVEKYFEKANCYAWVTSGLRSADDQLRIIRNELKRRNLESKYADVFTKGVNDKVTYGSQSIFAWQLGWSALLNAGYIVNPPVPAICLMDYISGGVNKKGKLINASPHFAGTAFNVGGGADGIAGNVNNELAVIQKALNDKLPGLKSFLAERNNNAVHVNCQKV
jgi:hypothetical protein